MRYLIDGKIIFEPEKDMLYRQDDSLPRSPLPRPASLLLLTLIKNSGLLLSRNSLMEEAWDRHGFRVSGHNLNTYLSVLRHALQDLECPGDLIKTLPRQGVIMNGGVVSLEAENEETLSTQPPHKPRAEKHKGLFFPLYCTLLIVMSALLVLIVPVSRSPDFTPSSPWPLTHIDQCQVYALGTVPKKEALAAVRKEPRLQTLCAQEDYQVFVSLAGDEKTALSSITYCHLRSKKGLSACTTSYREDAS